MRIAMPTRTNRRQPQQETAARERGSRQRSNGRSAPRSAEPQATEVRLVPIDEVALHCHHPRVDFDPAEIERLARSMERVEQMQPLLVCPGDDGRFDVLHGARRLRAAQQLNWPMVRVEVCDAAPAAALLLMGLDEFYRQELNPIERAQYLRRLSLPPKQGGAGLRIAEIAKQFDKSGAWATNLIRLLSLPEHWQARVVSRETSGSQARLLLPHKDDPQTMAAIDEDFQAHPEQWRTRVDYERNIAMIAQGVQALRQPARNADTAAAVEPPRKLPERPSTKYAELLEPFAGKRRALQAIVKLAQQMLDELSAGD